MAEPQFPFMACLRQALQYAAAVSQSLHPGQPCIYQIALDYYADTPESERGVLFQFGPQFSIVFSRNQLLPLRWWPPVRRLWTFLAGKDLDPAVAQHFAQLRRSRIPRLARRLAGGLGLAAVAEATTEAASCAATEAMLGAATEAASGMVWPGSEAPVRGDWVDFRQVENELRLEQACAPLYAQLGLAEDDQVLYL